MKDSGVNIPTREGLLGKTSVVNKQLVGNDCGICKPTIPPDKVRMFI
jgi:hypothetical protein